MDEQKDFGETRMFSPEALKRFQTGVEGEVPPETARRRSPILLRILLILFTLSAAGLVWTFRAPIRHKLASIFHHR